MDAQPETAVHELERVAVRPKPRTEEEKRAQQLPPFAVVLHNDDVNSFEFVIGVLQKVFGYGLPQAFMLTRQAHETGRSIVWTGSREVAELKAEQVHSCGPDPVMAHRGAQPLRVTVEPQ
jgi:ATP-dependent Clp protease adaptor protein ClpS